MKRLSLLFFCIVGLALASCRDDAMPPSLPAERAPVGVPTPTLNQVAQVTATSVAPLLINATPSATPDANQTPTLTPLPTEPPSLSERLTLAEAAMAIGDYAQAIEHYGAVGGATTESKLRNSVRLKLAAAHFADENFVASRAILNQVLNDEEPDPAAYYFRGQIALLQGNCVDAIADFEAAVPLLPEIASYLHGWIADCHSTLEDTASAIEQYDLAQQADAHFLVTFQQRTALAQLYGAMGQFEESAETYALMRSVARTDYTRGEMGYFEAQARFAAEDEATGVELFYEIIIDYPQNYTSYLALIELITSGAAVDQYARGEVDYFAEAYLPCVDAFDTYLAQNPSDFNEQALLYLAWCHEGLGNIELSLATFDKYVALGGEAKTRGLLEKGEMLRRQSRYAGAIAAYNEVVEKLPDSDAAAEALFWIARLNDWSGETAIALEAYQELAGLFPDYERTPNALFRAGFLASDVLNDRALALSLWRTAAERYPNDYHGEASFMWLVGSGGNSFDLQPLAEAYTPRDSFYSARVWDWQSGRGSFAPVENYTLELDQVSAENTLRRILDLSPTSQIDRLPPNVREDPHIVRGEMLWELQRFEDAKLEFEYVRSLYAENVLVSYQLALYYRDIGLYRSSILAAQAVIDGLDANPFTAPKFVVGLAYPVYYADIIMQQAQQYGYDPFVQFALVRQESLYESFATSFAAAQGLAQVIPDTGYYIAEKLAWPDYVNEDLYKPYVGLRFGSFYLDEQLSFFERQVHPALAAYNAGPGNAYNWWVIAGDNIDRYVETTNFAETRAYNERIYTGHAIYRHVYGIEGEIESEILE